MLLLFPKTILENLLTGWLTLSEVGKLDSAFCERENRHTFEQALGLGSYGCTSVGPCQSESFLSWSVKRKIEVRDIVIGTCLVEKSELRYAFLNSTGTHLRSIVFVPMKDTHNSTVIDTRVNGALQDISMLCQNLEELEVHTPNDSAVRTVLARNPKLRRVSLEGKPELLTAVAHLVPSISCVAINSKIYETELVRFLNACPANLTHLHLPSCDFEHTVLPKLTACAMLVDLRIGNMAPNHLEYVKVSLPRLVVFQCGLKYLTDDNFNKLGMCMPSLQTLIVVPGEDLAMTSSGNCPFHVTPTCLENVLTYLPKLRQFVTETACEHLLRAPPLPDAPAPVPVTARAEQTAKQSRTKKAPTHPVSVCALEELYITLADAFYSFGAVFARCPALRYVGVSSVPLKILTDPHPCFLQLCSQVPLQRLVITNCTAAKDEHMMQVRNLRAIHQHFCTNLTDQACMALARHNPHLQVLSIRHAGSEYHNPVTHRALLTFLDHCPELRSVEFTFRTHGTHHCGAAPASKSFGKAMFQQMLRQQYPNVQHFECNVV